MLIVSTAHTHGHLEKRALESAFFFCFSCFVLLRQFVVLFELVLSTKWHQLFISFCPRFGARFVVQLVRGVHRLVLRLL